MLAFCAIQLLTIGVCLAGWLHKHKAKQASSRTQMSAAAAAAAAVAADEQRHSQHRFLGQILRQHQPTPLSPGSQRLF